MEYNCIISFENMYANNEKKINENKNSRGSIMNRSTFQRIEYMNGSVFFQSEIGLEILARTTVPKLPTSYLHPPPEV